MSFNLDVGSGPTPSASYSAAAGQSGSWMLVGAATPFTAIPLSNIYGAATGVTLTYDSGFDFSANNPLTHGDDEALLDDTQGVFSLSHWNFAGLRPGDYEVWSYAWAPDSPVFFKTRVVVTGSNDPPQVVGGQDWTGSFVQGAHYAKHAFTVAGNGVLEIVFSVASSACTINGVQLREITPPPDVYCNAGSSTHACQASIHGVGTASASASNGFTISATQVEGQRLGLIFYGTGGRTATPWGGGSSFMCLATPIQRTHPINSGGTTGACDGVLSVDWNAYLATHPGAVGNPRYAGEVFRAQAWYRDLPAPAGTNLSNAIEFTLAP